MPTLKIDRTRIMPYYPDNKLERRNWIKKIISTSTGEYALTNPGFFEDTFNHWMDIIPGPGSERRLRIRGCNFQEAEQFLKEIDISNWIGLNSSYVNYPRYNSLLITMALNIYSTIKTTYPEDAPRNKERKLITYRIDFIKINDDQKEEYEVDFNGRCIINAHSSTIRALIFDLSKYNWESFWIRVAILYETIFIKPNDILEDPPHLRVKHKPTQLEDEYTQREKGFENIPKEYLIEMIKSLVLPPEVYDQIYNILQEEELEKV